MKKATHRLKQASWTPIGWRVVTAMLLASNFTLIAKGLGPDYQVYGMARDLGIGFGILAIGFGTTAFLRNTFGEWFYALFYNKKARYWFIVTLLIVLGTHMGDWLDEQQIGVNVRYQLYQIFQTIAPAPRAKPHDTALILIGDQEFWEGPLARRLPLKRDYLAELLENLALAEPRVIAFDFDLRSPVPDGTACDHGSLPHERCEYQGETQNFLEKIKEVSRKRPVILPRTMRYGDKQQCYVPEPAIFDGFNFEGGNVREGYIEFPYDVRQVPLSFQMNDGTKLDSLATAIVQAEGKTVPQGFSATDCGSESLLPYGDFRKAKDFDEVTLSASEVLLMAKANPAALREKLGHKRVIVGGTWHSRASGRGEEIDLHLTPVGVIRGIYVHANYVEALQTPEVLRKSLHKYFGRGIEILLAIVVAMTFALDIQPKWRTFRLLGLCVGLIALTYILWQNLGVFFDFFIPILLLFGHVGYEQISEWRTGAQMWRKHILTCPHAREA
jgi:CHASE2 domain-containing sensor protein